MSELLITLEWNLHEKELKPDIFSKNYKIIINDNVFNLGPPLEYDEKINKVNPEQPLSSAISSYYMYKMHDRSHRYCFIANSLSEEIKIKN